MNKIALIVLLVILFAGIAFVLVTPKLHTFPENMTREGTKYTNCHITSNYPFKTEKELITITGVLKTKVGSMMTPWKAAVVDDKYLFNPLTKFLIENFEDMDGRFVVVRGYSGQGQITMQTMGQSLKVNFTNVFYVSEIVGWTNVCCDTMNTKNVCFWVKT